MGGRVSTPKTDTKLRDKQMEELQSRIDAANRGFPELPPAPKVLPMAPPPSPAAISLANAETSVRMRAATRFGGNKTLFAGETGGYKKTA